MPSSLFGYNMAHFDHSLSMAAEDQQHRQQQQSGARTSCVIGGLNGMSTTSDLSGQSTFTVNEMLMVGHPLYQVLQDVAARVKCELLASCPIGIEADVKEA